MINLSVNTYKISIELGERPLLYDFWLMHAKYFDLVDLNKEGTAVYMGIANGEEWYSDIIAFRAELVDEAEFSPSLLLIPETATLFIGAGTLIKIYDLDKHKIVDQKEFIVGFWGWERIGQHVLMAGDLNFCVYDLNGVKLWSAYVEPPWTYRVENGIIALTVEGKTNYRNLFNGNLIG